MNNPFAQIEEKLKKAMKEAGYGRTMQLAQEEWIKSLKEQGLPGDAALAYGPCLAMLVDCGCKKPYECDWCCGTGRVTKKVKEAKKNNGI